jgi:diguanylate cyclase (GGDEF)-like protein
VRYGGEEFACVLPDADHAEAMTIAHDIRDRIRALGIPHSQSDAAPYVTVSVGVATATCSADADPLSWIKAADAQLYLAKAAGRNGVMGRVFTEAEMQTIKAI